MEVEDPSPELTQLVSMGFDAGRASAALTRGGRSSAPSICSPLKAPVRRRPQRRGRQRRCSTPAAALAAPGAAGTHRAGAAGVARRARPRLQSRRRRQRHRGRLHRASLAADPSRLHPHLDLKARAAACGGQRAGLGGAARRLARHARLFTFGYAHAPRRPRPCSRSSASRWGPCYWSTGWSTARRAAPHRRRRYSRRRSPRHPCAPPRRQRAG